LINFGDSGLIVQYIQNFLKDNYDKSMSLSDTYDKQTHKTLINYLKLPEIIDANRMKDLIHQMFVFREDQPPNKLIDGGGVWNFDFEMTPYQLRFYNRPINQCFDGALQFINQYMQKVDDLCRKFGWRLTYYTKFKYIPGEKKAKVAEFIITQESRKQLLPTKELMKMINFSCGDYLLSKCFLDEKNKYHGFIQDSKYFKIAVIEAKPGDIFSITHGYKYPCEIAIAHTEHTLKEMKQEGYAVKQIVSYLENSPTQGLVPLEVEVYKIPEDSDCKYLLIQMPFKNNLISPQSQKVKVILGDILGEGKPSQASCDLLKEWVLANESIKAGEVGVVLPFTLSGARLIAANINRDLNPQGEPIIDMQDVVMYQQELNRNPATPWLGEAIFEKPIDLSESDYDRLLVMYGDWMEGNNLSELVFGSQLLRNKNENVLNIPIVEYQDNPWAIHECFIPFIIGSAIHEYSDLEDIRWLQEKIQEYYPQYKGKYWGCYDKPEDYIADEEMKWNPIKSKWEYWKRGTYSGYILDQTINPLNGWLRHEYNMEKTPIQIVNGKWLINKQWTGSIVLSDGRITTEYAKNSLKQIIKDLQMKLIEHIRNHRQYYKGDDLTEMPRFANGYITPLTEKYLNDILANYVIFDHYIEESINKQYREKPLT